MSIIGAVVTFLLALAAAIASGLALWKHRLDFAAAIGALFWILVGDRLSQVAASDLIEHYTPSVFGQQTMDTGVSWGFLPQWVFDVPYELAMMLIITVIILYVSSTWRFEMDEKYLHIIRRVEKVECDAKL